MWPENWRPFNLFASLPTQWNFAGMSGQRTGLRYEALYPLLDRSAASPVDWDQLFDDIRVMEQGALDAMQESSK